MINVIVTAPKGKMDKLIIQELIENKENKEGYNLVGAVGAKGRDYIGKDAGIVAGSQEEAGVPVYEDIREIIQKADVVVDFSTRELSMEVVKVCQENKKALICGTTGFTPEEQETLAEAAKEIPLLLAANTSRMVNVMTKAMAQLAKDLKGKCKIEIIDMHDEKKVDAPSGTAKEFGEVMAKVSGVNAEDMDFHSIRAGDISSSHTIIFGGKGERIELTHHSYNWECYARGACDAIDFIMGKEPGLYKIEQVF